jgi:hypothetical protein
MRLIRPNRVKEQKKGLGYGMRNGLKIRTDATSRLIGLGKYTTGFEIHRVFCFFCFRISIFTDFIQSPIIYFWWCDLGNPRPAKDFPRPPPQIFCGVSKWKNVFLTSQGQVAHFYAPKVNCSPFQFVIFSYPMGIDYIVLCNPLCWNVLPCFIVGSCLSRSCSSLIILCVLCFIIVWTSYWINQFSKLPF